MAAPIRRGDSAVLGFADQGQRWFDYCGRGSAWCLRELDKPQMAVEIVEQLLELDPDDPLGLASWLDELRAGDKQVVELRNLWKS